MWWIFSEPDKIIKRYAWWRIFMDAEGSHWSLERQEPAPRRASEKSLKLHTASAT